MKKISFFIIVVLVLVFTSCSSNFLKNNNVYIKTVAVGSTSTFVIKSDNTLWGWGESVVEYFGDEVTERSELLKIMDNVVDIIPGSFHYFVIRTDGSLWGWGFNAFGQLGDGTVTTRSRPVEIMDSVISVAVGSHTSFAVKEDGTLWAWGENRNGQLGDGTTIDRREPVKIMENATRVSSGRWNSYAVKTNGALWAWGWNSWHRLFPENFESVNPYYELLPVQIGDNVSFVAMGEQSTDFIIKHDDSLWAWGANCEGQLGIGTVDEIVLIPVKVMENVAYVTSSIHHTLALTDDGILWAWGSNYDGELGDGTTIRRTTPVKIMEDVETIVAGYSHVEGLLRGRSGFAGRSFAVKTDGSLWGWGFNDCGKFGDEAYVATPVRIM